MLELKLSPSPHFYIEGLVFIFLHYAVFSRNVTCANHDIPKIVVLWDAIVCNLISRCYLYLWCSVLCCPGEQNLYSSHTLRLLLGPLCISDHIRILQRPMAIMLGSAILIEALLIYHLWSCRTENLYSMLRQDWVLTGCIAGGFFSPSTVLGSATF
jgi:hypothetical protein